MRGQPRFVAPRAPNAGRLASLLIVLLLIMLGGLVGAASRAADHDSEAAGTWLGKEVMQKGILHVLNPSRGRQPPLEVVLCERWRLGGDSEEAAELFGVIADLATDADGNLLVLDRQLCRISVFSPSGEHLRTIGGEGEGPGEFRRPGSMVITEGGLIGVSMSVPGRIVQLTPGGEPAGDHPLPAPPGGGTLVLENVACNAGNLVIKGLERTFTETYVDQNIYWERVGPDGHALARYYETMVRDIPAQMVADETERGSIHNRWAVGADGRVWLATTYLGYRIEVWLPDGRPDRIIERDYESRRRSAAERQRVHDMIASFTRHWPVPTEVRVSDFDMDLVRLHPRDDGSCWVMTSRGQFDRPAGSMGVFEVHDAAGRFERQITLLGPGDPARDAFWFLDQRLFVVRGLLDARLAATGGGVGAADEDGAPPLTIICYDLDPLP